MLRVMASNNPCNNFRDKISTFSAVIFVLSFIVVGLPLWWKTTETYKVPLPYNEIDSLMLHEIVHLIPVTVILADRTVHQSALWEKLMLLSDQEYDNTENMPKLKFQYSWKMRSTNKDEEAALMFCTNMYDLDKVLNNGSVTIGSGEIHIIVLEENFGISPSSFVIGCHRRGYIMNNFDNELSNRLGEKILSLVKILVQPEVLHQHFNNPLSVKKKPEKERMRSVSTTTFFDINFSLIVPEPLKNDVHWDVETAINGYIIPYVQQLSVIAKIGTKSQILYMSSLPMNSTFNLDKKSHLLNEEHLPSIINPIEAKLGYFASISPTLNFIVYIPPEEQSPLYISDTAGFLVTSNAFLSPQWGGFLFYNLPNRNRKNIGDSSYRIDLDMHRIMEVFLGHLKLLLGLPDVVAIENDNLHILQDPVLSDWEVDFLLRKNCQEQLFSATSSLHSLGHLLQTIGNIVIKDDIGKKIYSSISSIKKSVSLLQYGALEDAFIQAKQGFRDSEAAFFDPSLLALLYFPDDQKYAIYIPLFLPISIPVIMSLRYIWKYWKESDENVERKDKND